ncbi:hypothetical protein BG015_005058 [Linnemannia schmuckeri]|uniref:non-specific serine/threonine protein kinase n=1 Tax=Linnemannia schmuckeri TaxID=64567 RepID=A0A9P5S160_9FUNG|nr:hypothetical protein BG015_005058 [Linnemannia schmuckeri]
MLGNCIGKGAFGSVWRGLHDTGTTVAVKQINLSDIPSAELDNIMHANIVKYYGFEKTTEFLNIILEFCENGSLRSLCKNFGKLPEHLGATYITQVLDGLIYLHDQGVIHRDIKGANILATKEGVVKLADFGVATLSNDVGDMSVAGTPYWMAPEIIELSGATTASDIWSVGCTVIELLDGEPPYHDLPPMGALYRIVQDDHPPIPEGVSAIVRDFLMQCFQKDCNLRVSAKKLSKHPWIQMSRKKATGSQRSREKAVPAYEEAVKSVQQWNEALKGSSNRNSGKMRRMTNEKAGRSWEHGVPAITDIYHAPRPQVRDIFSPSAAAAGAAAIASGLRPFPERPPVTVSPPHFHLPSNNNALDSKAIAHNNVTNNKNVQNYEESSTDNNWDDDFADGALSFQIAAQGFREQEDEVSKTIRAMPSTAAGRHQPYAIQPESPGGSDMGDDDFEDDAQDFRLKLMMKPMENKRRQAGSRQADGSLKSSGSLAARSKTTGPHVPIDLVRSRSAPGQLVLAPRVRTSNIQNYREEEDEDFSDLFEGPESPGNLYQDEGLTLQSRLSNHSWFGNDAGSDEEDPFAEVDEGFDEIDMEANIAREKYARICANIAEQFRLLENQKNQRSEKQLEVVCDRLMVLLAENPDARGPMMANHGAIPLLDLIENSKQPNLVLKLLNILNMVIRNDFALQENLCLVGAIPVLIKYTSKRYVKEIQLAAALFIQQICHTNSLTLQMFISCRGLSVLIEFLQGNYMTQKELVWIAINGIHSVFKLQSLTPRNDFCRLLAKQGLLDPLSATLYNTLRDPQGAAYTDKIVQVLLIFSQGDSPVKELLATRQIVHRMLSSLQNLTPSLCVMMLKCIKNISMNSNTLDVLQNASAINTLVQVLGERTGSFDTRAYQDVCNHVLTTLFNLCRINKARQEEAAQAGLIPHLQQIAESSSPLKQFALPILCDMAHAGRACRNSLWHNDCLPVYLRLFKDPHWQVNAMDAVLVWLQDETADVEQILLQPSSLNLFVQAFLTAKANSFENILEPLYKIVRFSPSIARGIAVPPLFHRLLDRLAHPKAVVRSNLLRILRAIFEVHPERLQIVAKYGIARQVARIAAEDNAVLVKELAKEILDVFEESDSEGTLSSKDDGDDEDDEDDGVFSVRFTRNQGPNHSYDSTGGLFAAGKGFKTGASTSALASTAAPTTAASRRLQDITTSELMPDDLDSNKRTPSPRYLQDGRFKGRPPAFQHDVEDLFQKDVDNLNIKETNRLFRGSTGDDGGASASTPKGIVRSRSKAVRDSGDDLRASSPGSEDDHFVTTRPWTDSSPENAERPSSLGRTKITAATSILPTTTTTVRMAASTVSSPDTNNRRAHQKLQAALAKEPTKTVRILSRRQYGHQKSRSLSEILESYVAEGKKQSHRLLDGLRTEDLSESMILRREMPKIRLDLLDLDHVPFRDQQDLIHYESEEEEEEEEEDKGDREDIGTDEEERSESESEEVEEEDGSEDEEEDDEEEEDQKSLEGALLTMSLQRMSPSPDPVVYSSVTTTSAKDLAQILQDYQLKTTTRRQSSLDSSFSYQQQQRHHVQQQQQWSDPSRRSGSGSNSSDPTIRIRGPVFAPGGALPTGGRRSSQDSLVNIPSVPSFSAIASSAAAAGGWNRRLLDSIGTTEQEEDDDDNDDDEEVKLMGVSRQPHPFHKPAAPVVPAAAVISGSPGLQLVARQIYDDELDFGDSDDDDDDDDEDVGADVRHMVGTDNGIGIGNGNGYHINDNEEYQNDLWSDQDNEERFSTSFLVSKNTANKGTALQTRTTRNDNDDDNRHNDDDNDELKDVNLSDDDDETAQQWGLHTHHRATTEATVITEEDEDTERGQGGQQQPEAEEIDWAKEERRHSSSLAYTQQQQQQQQQQASITTTSESRNGTLRRRTNRDRRHHQLSLSTASLSASASATSLLSSASSSYSSTEEPE